MFSVCLQAATAANKLSSEWRGRKHTKHVSHHGQGGGHIAMLVVPQSWVFWDSCSSAKHVWHPHKLACTMQDRNCAQQNALTFHVHFKVIWSWIIAKELFLDLQVWKSLGTPTMNTAWYTVISTLKWTKNNQTWRAKILSLTGEALLHDHRSGGHQ